MEVWIRDAAGPWRLLKRYPFTGFSGALGPKLREGDGQIPEGVYGIEYLNPNSSYHLSLKVDYPNAFDRRMAALEGRTQPGTDIFIHGGSATIGCIPLGDPAVEEVFVLVASVGRERTRVILAPRDFRAGHGPPAIETVGWEDQLYPAIQAALRPFSEAAPPHRPAAARSR